MSIVIFCTWKTWKLWTLNKFFHNYRIHNDYPRRSWTFLSTERLSSRFIVTLDEKWLIFWRWLMNFAKMRLFKCNHIIHSIWLCFPLILVDQTTWTSCIWSFQQSLIIILLDPALKIVIQIAFLLWQSLNTILPH